MRRLSVEHRCNHVEDILPVNAVGAARSFQANDMPKRNLERDPREIRFTGVVMTNEGSVLVRITRQVKQEFLRGGENKASESLSKDPP